MVEILVWILSIFVVGGVLLLERRCIGQIAIVQPMVVCLVAGLFLGQPAIGIWMGVTLQLLSVGQSHYCNWALAGIVAAATLLCGDILGVSVVPGTLGSLTILILATAAGIMAEHAELRQARTDSELSKKNSVWGQKDSIKAFEKLVHRRILRGFLLGGLQSTLGVLIATALLYGIDNLVMVEKESLQVVVVAVPAFGIAVTLSSLSEYKFAGYAGVGVLAFVGLTVFV